MNSQIINQQFNQTFGNEVEQQKEEVLNDQVDLVFMFADPLVVDYNGKKIEYMVSLDLDSEYSNICKNLYKTRKQFRIQKRAISKESLSEVITQDKPKIIHLSCHGSYDIKDGNKEFYISIEQDKGQEYKLSQSQLRDMLVGHKNQHEIKLVVVSACQSEEIGRIFHESGIPVVIAVNSSQEIADEACGLFSMKFYEYLLKGNSIMKAFDQAKNQVAHQINNYDVCCCAHKHSDQCLWYKFYQRYPDEAHQMHSGDCQCKEEHISQKKHQFNCEIRKKFHNFMLELQKNPDLTPTSMIYQDNQNTIDQPVQIQGKLQQQQNNNSGGLLNAFDFDDDSDLEMMDEIDRDGFIQEQRIAQSDEQLILCCCQKEERHDETMKFIKFKKSHEDQCIELFAMGRVNGTLINDEDNKKNVIPQSVDKWQILGRQAIVHDILNFLISRGKDKKRLLAINGFKSYCGIQLAQFAVKYAMDRQYLEDGAFYINMENQQSEQTLINLICKKIWVYTTFNNSDLDQAIQQIKNQRMLFLIDNCDAIIDKGGLKFVNQLLNFIQQTNSLKIIFITNKEDISNTIKGEEENFEQIQLKSLKRADAVRMLFYICKNQIDFRKQFPSDQILNQHPIFDDIQDFSPLEIQAIGTQILKKVQTLDDMHQDFKIQRQHCETLDKRLISENQLIMKMYNRVMSNHPLEIIIFQILSLSSTGLYYDDLTHIENLNKKINKSNKMDFGDWKHFISCSLFNKFDDQQQEHQQCDSLKLQINVNLLKEVQSESVGITKLVINSIIQPNVRQQALDNKNNIQQTHNYLCYMSLLSRLLLIHIKMHELQEINIQILSNQIDQGMWSISTNLGAKLKAMQTILSEQFQFELERNPINIFIDHEQNLLLLLDIKTELLGQHLESAEVVEFYSEICLNLASIYYMLDRHQDIEQLYDRISAICEHKQAYQIIFAKFQLMQHSLRLNQGLSNSIEMLVADKIFIEQNHLEGTLEFEYLSSIHLLQDWKTLYLQKTNIQPQVITNQRRQSLKTNNIQDQLQIALLKLKKCIQSEISTNLSILKAKATIIYCEIIFELNQEQPDMFDRIKSNKNLINLNQLLEHLQTSIETFNNLDYPNLSIQSQYLYAMALFQDEEYYQCRLALIRCIKQARAYSLNNHFQKSKQLFDQVSQKIKTAINHNKFYFIKSQNIDQSILGENHKYMISHIQMFDKQSQFTKILEEANKQIEIKFGILNQQFLQSIKNDECKVLHISQNMFATNLSGTQDTILVEGPDFKQNQVTANQFKKMLNLEPGRKLNISLVILDKLNSQDFVKLFNHLGVEHVISFKLNPTCLLSLNLKQKITQQVKNQENQLCYSKMNLENIINQEIIKYETSYFCFYFAQKLYPNLLANMAVREAINNAKVYAESKLADQNMTCKIDVVHKTQYQNQQNMQLFDMSSFGERRDIDDGELCIVDDLRAHSNIDFEQNQTPFIFKVNNQFKNIINSINNYQVKKQQIATDISTPATKLRTLCLNVFGHQGIGKTRLMKEIASFLRFRHKFKDGIILIDGSNYDQVSQMQDLLHQNFESKFQKITSRTILATLKGYNQSQANLNKLDKQSEDNIINSENGNSLLFIIDNCDQLIKERKSQFLWNLNYFQNNAFKSVLIFVSREKLIQKFTKYEIDQNQLSFEAFEIQRFDYVQSMLFLKLLNINKKFANLNLLQRVAHICEGNPSLLKIIGYIIQFAQGQANILDKIKLLPVSKLEEQLETQINNSIKTNQNVVNLKQKWKLDINVNQNQLGNGSQSKIIDIMNQAMKQMVSNVKEQKNTKRNRYNTYSMVHQIRELQLQQQNINRDHLFQRSQTIVEETQLSADHAQIRNSIIEHRSRTNSKLRKAQTHSFNKSSASLTETLIDVPQNKINQQRKTIHHKIDNKLLETNQNVIDENNQMSESSQNQSDQQQFLDKLVEINQQYNQQKDQNQINNQISEQITEQKNDSAQDDLVDINDEESESNTSIILSEEEMKQDLFYESQNQNDGLLNIEGFIIQASDIYDQDIMINMMTDNSQPYGSLIFFIKQPPNYVKNEYSKQKNQTVTGFQNSGIRRSQNIKNVQFIDGNQIETKSEKQIMSQLPQNKLMRQLQVKQKDKVNQLYSVMRVEQLELIKDIKIYLPTDFNSKKQKAQWIQLLKSCQVASDDLHDQSN